MLINTLFLREYYILYLSMGKDTRDCICHKTVVFAGTFPILSPSFREGVSVRFTNIDLGLSSARCKVSSWKVAKPPSFKESGGWRE